MARGLRKENVESTPSFDGLVAGRRLIAENLRKLRRRTGLSQEALADSAHIHRTYVGSVERGERNISIDLICRLALALNVHPKEFLTPLGESGEESPIDTGRRTPTKGRDQARKTPGGWRKA